MDKKNQRISKSQKQKLIGFMANNLELARGQFSGINSNSNFKEQWESLRNKLNSLGGSDKTVEQWKKCWTDLKAAVKKHVNSRRSFINQTGGGSWVDVPRDLDAMEEEILKIITINAVDGDCCTPESGVPVNSSDNLIVIEDDEISPPLPKKAKETPQKPSMTIASKYKVAIEESQEMHLDLVSKIEKLEKQNELLLEKLSNTEKIQKQNELILEKLATFEKIEKQNELILEKLSNIEDKLSEIIP